MCSMPELRDPLRQIGYFHCGNEDKSDPVGALTKAIESEGGKSKVENSLIVLPEAFNLKVTYERGARPDFEQNIEGALKTLAAKYQLVLLRD
jgi:hypothetical protein